MQYFIDIMTEFGFLWYVDFSGMMYAWNENEVIVGPHFPNTTDAQKIYDNHISKWNSRYVHITFIEDADEYEFVCYQDPKFSYDKINFGFYRSSMNKTGHYSAVRDRIPKECKLVIFHDNPPNINNMIGVPMSVGNAKIISVGEVKTNTYEYFARKSSGHKYD